jgi:hypothetical protein
MRWLIGTAALAATFLLAASEAAGQVRVGDFYFFERIDAESGEDASSITTVAAENQVTGAGGLTWACSEGELQVTVTSTYLGQSRRVRVRTQFDDEELSGVQQWILKPTGMAVTAPRAVSAEFTERAKMASQVAVEVTDYQYRRNRYTFTLGGLEEALSMLPCTGDAESSADSPG